MLFWVCGDLFVVVIYDWELNTMAIFMVLVSIILGFESHMLSLLDKSLTGAMMMVLVVLLVLVGLCL